jgi:RNA polymerase sigma-70 factor (ECF subfamily)
VTPTPTPSRPATAAPPPALPGEIERFYAAESPKAYRAAYRITGSAVDAEDVVQTVFLRLLARQDVALREGSEGYVYRSAVNAALDVVRSRQRAGWVPLEDPETGAAPALVDPNAAADAAALAGHETQRLRRCLRLALSRLSPRTAEMFALRYFEGLSNREIAALLDTSSGVVAVLLHRARTRLKKELTLLLGDTR